MRGLAMTKCNWCGEYFDQRPDMHLSHSLDPFSGNYCSKQCATQAEANQGQKQKTNAEAVAVFAAVAAVIVLFLLPSILPNWICTSAGFGDAVEAALGSLWSWLWSLCVWSVVIALCLPRGRKYLSQWFSWLKSSGLATTSYVAKQTERTKILNVSLPQAFTALGKHVYSANNLRNDFRCHWALQRVPARGASKGTNFGF
jgi:hypothetical protein